MKKSKLILFITLLLSLCLAVFAGCSTESKDPKKSITFNQSSFTATVFEEVVLTAQKENISEKITWSVSDDSIATVDNGLVLAKKAGSVKVTATAEGVSATAQVTFTTVDSSRLVLESECVELELFVGDEVNVDSYVKFDGEIVLGGNFTLSSSNSDVLEITSDGKVSAVEVGVANVVINGTIKGITLTETTVPVTVKEGVELFTGAENDAVTIYISEGAKNQYATNYTLAPIVEIRKQPVADAVFDYVTEDSNIITLENGIVKAKAIGAAIVDISYTSAKGTISKQLIVNVVKPSTTILEDEKILLSVNTENDLSVLDIDEHIDEISVNGVKSEITVVGNSFTFNTAIQGGLGANVVIYTEKEDFVLTADVYDYIADTKEEFKAFGIATKTNPQTTLALAGNIDYEMGNFFTDCGFDISSTFSGLFDGMGYTVYNIKGNNGLFANFNNVTLKNVAFFNVVRDTYNGGGSIVNDMSKDSQNNIENVYIQVKFTVYTGSTLAGFSGITNGHFNSVVIHADFLSNPNQYNAFAYSFHKGQEPILENCYVISSNSNGQMYDGVTEGVYTDAKSFNEDVDVSAFNTDYWEVANGMLVFKSAKDIILAAYPVADSISITNTQTQFDGSLIEITTDLSENVSVYLKNDYEGLAIEDGCLVAKDSCVAGNVTVVAEWQHPILGYTVSAEKTFAVKSVQFVYEKQTVMVAKNRNEDFAYDLSKYNLTAIESAEFNNKLLEKSFANGTLTIAKTEFDSVTANLKVTAMAGENKYVICIPVESVDYAIGTKTELQAFGVAVKTDTDAVAVLTANINYEMGNFSTDSGYSGGTPSYSGVLDGKGFAIYNVKARNGMFTNLDNVTIKNIAFYNVVRETSDVGGALANVMTGNNVLENVYIQINFTATAKTNIAGIAWICEGTFTNVVLDLNFSGVPNTYNAWGASCNKGKAPVLNNCYVISSNSNGELFGELAQAQNPVVINSQLYTSKQEFVTDSATIKANFSDDYWKIDASGALVFINVVA